MPLYAHTVVEAKDGKERKKSTAILADEPGACYAHLSKFLTSLPLGQDHALNLRKARGRRKRKAKKMPTQILSR